MRASSRSSTKKAGSQSRLIRESRTTHQKLIRERVDPSSLTLIRERPIIGQDRTHNEQHKPVSQRETGMATSPNNPKVAFSKWKYIHYFCLQEIKETIKGNIKSSQKSIVLFALIHYINIISTYMAFDWRLVSLCPTATFFFRCVYNVSCFC